MSKSGVPVEHVPYPEDVVRPRTRGDCNSVALPCPFVSCRYHLYLDVNPGTGHLKLNFPDLEPHELTETCALDVAESGGEFLEVVGKFLNVTKERARQIEEQAQKRLKVLQRQFNLIEWW